MHGWFCIHEVANGGIHQNRPYTKSTKSQKLKAAQKKSYELKNHCQGNLVTVEQLFLLVGGSVGVTVNCKYNEQ